MSKLIILCVFAGLIAGFGAGFGGISAAIIIAPVLSTFYGMPAYDAIGIALAVDVVSSGSSAVTFWRNKNVDIHGSLTLLIPLIIFTALGSWLSIYIPNNTLSGGIVFFSLILGLKYLFKPEMTLAKRLLPSDPKIHAILLLASGTIIGSICGICGAGGGMMVMIVLKNVLRFDLKTSLGTGIFCMIFIALIGAVTHFLVSGLPNLTAFAVSALAAFSGAKLAALWANRTDHKCLARIIGIMFTALGTALLIGEFIVTIY
jgi:hypothetical protein